MECQQTHSTPDTVHFACDDVNSKPTREYLYNGETVCVEGVFDGVKLSLYNEINPNPKSPKKDSRTDLDSLNPECSPVEDNGPQVCNTALDPHNINYEESSSNINLQSIEGQVCSGYEYITGNRPYCIPCSVVAVKFEYLEFSKSIECPESYCLSNVINNAEEVVLKSEIFSVVPPFQLIEKIQGNYILVTAVPDGALCSSSSDIPVISINGRRMVHKENGVYKIKLLKISDWSVPIYISADFGQIHYTRKSSLVLPNDFMYSIGLKRIKEKFFIKLTLCRTLANSYKIIIMNPLMGDEYSEPVETLHTNSLEDALDVEMLDEQSIDISVQDLLVGALKHETIIDSPDTVTEILLQIQKKSSLKRNHLFSAKVNDFPIEFFIKI
ncbi:uncharacterized protein NEPG_02139 [Nematocida parisii ERTm1]|uniref:uncharacterized protein n=1 Tax=Nematocida parisii (strain ERTm1 / ATCC PRA-289) TaxID=881290 RepID=UPI000264B242|nr:uncharacterized protein NEPG_02139 [Nematocida parisii ERTm1]EIJ93183.1 hypothetical protein NEPG_02139 [Nematocida parisii ERTm1]KAI5145867.1 hypothetical protein NEPAR07_1915 [Nematocida parisii]KAI5158465.1 hypothetical protein NEPAR05_2004 [Nematocida parisii]|eukprot:XP_013059966.1 hypothetical protein NEPG_02139 [Nematocida parisii ERTm1]